MPMIVRLRRMIARLEMLKLRPCRYHNIWTDWQAVVNQIRLIPGYATFQEATPFGVLSKAAESGPLIIANVSDYRSDAIIVLKDEDAPVIVSLPGATSTYIQTLSDDLKMRCQASRRIQRMSRRGRPT